MPLTSRSFASKNVPSRLETCLAPASWTEGGSWGSKQTLAWAKRTGQIWTNRSRTDLTSTNVPHGGDYKSGVPLTSLLLTVCVQWSHICILLRSCCHIGLTVARSPQDWETAMVWSFRMITWRKKSKHMTHVCLLKSKKIGSARWFNSWPFYPRDWNNRKWSKTEIWFPLFWTKTDVIESNESSVASLISMKLDKQEDWYIRDESDDNQLIVKIV